MVHIVWYDYILYVYVRMYVYVVLNLTVKEKIQ